jgi:signal peptidase II
MYRWLFLSAVVIILDQVTKYLATVKLTYQIPVPVLPSFNWFLTHNTGAAFSLLSDAGGWQRWFFAVLAIVVSGIIFFWLRRLDPAEKLTPAALALVLGGALGNLIDRVYLGYVIDFIQLYYDRFYWPAFNVADSAITVGVTLLIVDMVFCSGRQSSNENSVNGS